jgi:hypothetical protein
LLTFSKLLIAAESFYVWTMVFLKISLGIFFLRILVERWQRRVVYLVVGLSCFFGFGYFWYAVFQCGVPNQGNKFWEKKIAKECSSTRAQVLGTGYAHAALTAMTDLSMALLPIPMLRRARITYKEKLVVGGILALAAV